RTDVHSANDRYANLETNYLLQRLESYEGIAIVTSNAPEHIDNAFQRRMDVTVNFVRPDAEEPRQSAQVHLPPGHPGGGETPAGAAAGCALTGGQIRNLSLGAALLALDDSAPAVRNTHVLDALVAEYRKAGAACPLGEARRPEDTHGGVPAFFRVLAE